MLRASVPTRNPGFPLQTRHSVRARNQAQVRSGPLARSWIEFPVLILLAELSRVLLPGRALRARERVPEVGAGAVRRQAVPSTTSCVADALCATNEAGAGVRGRRRRRAVPRRGRPGHVRSRRPQALTRCANGGIFVADTGNHRVRRIAASTGVISTVLGVGVAASSGEGEPSSTFPIDAPPGLTCDAGGNPLVSSTATVRLPPVSSTTRARYGRSTARRRATRSRRA